MEPLTFKIITDADDRGVRQYTNSLSKADLAGRKASGALKGFIQDLGEVNSGTDLASSALNAFSRILGGTLIGTGVVIIGKTLVDSFNRVSAAVKEARARVEETNKEITKIGMAGINFETATKQADLLAKTLEQNRKELEKINASRLDSFIAGIRGSKEELESLITTQKKQFEETQRQAIVQGLLDLERKKNVDEVTKAYQSAAEPYTKLIELARRLGDETLLNTIIIKQQTAGSVAGQQVLADATKKRLEDETKAKHEQAKAFEKIEKEQADFELKMIEATSSAKAQAYKMEQEFQIETLKKERERLDEVKRTISELRDREKQLEAELKVLKEIGATEAARTGGTGRGPGQRPTSFEVGLEEKLLREEYKRKSEFQEEYENVIRNQLKETGKAYDKTAVMRKIAELALEDHTKGITKNTEELRDIQRDLAATREKMQSLNKAQEMLESTVAGLSNSIFSASDSAYKFATSLAPAANDMVASFMGVKTASNDLASQFLSSGKNVTDLTQSFTGLQHSTKGFSDALGKATTQLGQLTGAGATGILASVDMIKGLLSENLIMLRSYSFAADPIPSK
jgi:hypothetical protein